MAVTCHWAVPDVIAITANNTSLSLSGIVQPCQNKNADTKTAGINDAIQVCQP